MARRSICFFLIPLIVGGMPILAAPKEPCESFRIKTDNIPQAEIAGWILPTAGKARGTVFLCHGYGTSRNNMARFQWLREQENWNVVLFDFREHGDSTTSRHLSSLGYFEVWDLKAVIDHAESRNLAPPYCIYGRSMGASVALRWASMDERIVGVLAASPFRNAYTASRQVASMKTRVSWPFSPFVLHRGFAQMLQEVDIPKAVAQRDDLRIWLLAGEHDCFPADDQEAILAASPSPMSYKRLLVAPGKGHSDTWTWKGNWQLPSHDDYLRQFLNDCRGKNSKFSAWVPGTSITVPMDGASPVTIGAGLMSVVLMWKMRRPRRRRKRLLTPSPFGRGLG